MGRNQDPIVATTIPQDWLDKLQALAEAAGKTQADLVYEAIAAYLSQSENAAFVALQTQVSSLEQRLAILTTDHNRLSQEVQHLTHRTPGAAPGLAPGLTALDSQLDAPEDNPNDPALGSLSYDTASQASDTVDQRVSPASSSRKGSKGTRSSRGKRQPTREPAPAAQSEAAPSPQPVQPGSTLSEEELEKLQKGIPAVALGRRLGVSSQSIANARKKGPEFFAEWSRNSNKHGKKADPDGLTWEWRDKGSTLKYYPIR